MYINTSREQPGGTGKIGQRWQAIRVRLAAAGAGTSTLDAIEAIVADPARSAPGRALFARDGHVIFTAPLAAPPRQEIARLGQLPHLLPLLAQRPLPDPHPRAATHRPRAALTAASLAGPARLGRSTARALPAVTGVPPPLPGRRARSPLAGMVPMSRGTAARHDVAASPDVAAGGAAMARAAAHSVTARAGRECRGRFGDWQLRRHQPGTVEGLGQTLAALRDGRVADLFIADLPACAATVWIGPDGTDLAACAADLHHRGVRTAVTERADAAVVRALAATDAELHFLPDDLVVAQDAGAGAGLGGLAFPRDGICATLRWDAGP